MDMIDMFVIYYDFFYSGHGDSSARVGSVHFSSRCNILFCSRHQYPSCHRDDFVLGRPFRCFQVAAMEKLRASYILVISVNIWHVDLSARYNQVLC